MSDTTGYHYFSPRWREWVKTDEATALRESGADSHRTIFVRFMEQTLLGLSTEDTQSLLLGALYCHENISGASRTYWDKTEEEMKAIHQQHQDAFDFVVDFIEQNKLQHFLNPQAYAHIFYNSQHFYDQKADRLYALGVAIPSDSEDSTGFWHDCLRNHSSNSLSGHAWLAKHNIWPLLSAGKDLSTKSMFYNDNTIFSQVTNKKHLDVLRFIPADKLKTVVNHQTQKGRTPLHHAVSQLLPEFVEFLLLLGADQNLTDKKGLFPLDVIKKTTSRVQHIEKIRGLLGGQSSKNASELAKTALKTLDKGLLAQAFAQPNDPKKPLPTKSDLLESVLGFSFKNVQATVVKKQRARQKDMMDFLMENDPTLFDFVDEHGNNPLHLAVANGALLCVERLLEQRPEMAGTGNTQKLLPQEMTITGFEFFYEPERTKNILDTSKKMLSLFKKHKALLTEHSFPDLGKDPATKALFAKAILLQRTDGLGGSSKKVSKL